MELVIFSRRQSLIKSSLYQIFSLNIHLRSVAERSIQKFKEHFIVGLCSNEPKHPSQKWDCLLPQATMTLHLFRKYRTNPKLLAYCIIFGIYDFNRFPLAPPGTEVIVHENTDKYWSWYTHGTDGWYIDLYMERYRRVQFYLPDKSSVRNVGKLTFSSAAIPLPKMETKYYLR